MNNKKQLLLSILLVLILALVIIGFSYVVCKFTESGKKESVITHGAIAMRYTKSSNTINLTNALPTKDVAGKVRLKEGEYFDFTVESTLKKNTDINYEISAEDVTSSAKKINVNNIKLYLTSLDDNGNEMEVMAPKRFTIKTSENKSTGRPSGVMSIATGIISASETTKYRLRMYADENYKPQKDLSFSIKINVYGKEKKESTSSKIVEGSGFVNGDGVSVNTAYRNTDFHTEKYQLNITSIITKKNNKVPATAIESWDISVAQDGSVMAYVEDDGTGNSTYKLTIGGKGGIIANDNMTDYFAGFKRAVSMDLSALDTSQVINMTNMFSDCICLSELDLSDFDTSKVTNMSYMFAYCSGLTDLNVSNFDTSNVTDMWHMFGDCSHLTSLNVSNFNTSKVTNMGEMFGYCGHLMSLDLSNFDTSNVTNMTCMFMNCRGLTNLDVSSFNTSKVTDMNCMFYCCSNLPNLDVSNFDTSNVTTMHFMFYTCQRLTSLDLSSFDTSKVTEMSYMFEKCEHLTSLDFRNATFDAILPNCFYRVFTDVPSTINIITKDATTKTWLEDKLGSGNGTVTIA